MIQLPPLPRDLDTEALKVLWEYAKMPKEGQKRMKEYFDMALKPDANPIDKTKEIIQKFIRDYRLEDKVYIINQRNL